MKKIISENAEGCRTMPSWSVRFHSLPERQFHHLEVSSKMNWWHMTTSDNFLNILSDLTTFYDQVTTFVMTPESWGQSWWQWWRPLTTTDEDLLITLMTTSEDLLLTCDDSTDSHCDYTHSWSCLDICSHSVNEEKVLLCWSSIPMTRTLRERTTWLSKTSWESLCSCWSQRLLGILY